MVVGPSWFITTVLLEYRRFDGNRQQRHHGSPPVIKTTTIHKKSETSPSQGIVAVASLMHETAGRRTLVVLIGESAATGKSL